MLPNFFPKHGLRSFCTINSLFIFNPFWIQTTFDQSIDLDNNETDKNEHVKLVLVR